MNYVGHIDEISRFHVAGWVADQDDWERSLDVEVLVDGYGLGFCPANCFRPNLDKLSPKATGKYAFRYYYNTPLSMYQDNEVTVRVSNSNFYLTKLHGPIAAIKGDRCCSLYRPMNSVLVSSMGRSGSTAVMAVLAQHPQIVVAGKKPYEVELGCYYAHALRTLAAAGDHQRSLRTDNITASDNRFHIGFNPYFEASFASVFQNPNKLATFISTSVPRRLGEAFRELILDYYEELAKEKNMTTPHYFAEKSLPERDSRLGIRFMFPHLKEIVLLRDFRDVLCSAMSSNHGDFDEILSATLAAAHQLSKIKDNTCNSVHFLKYEDFVCRKHETLERLFHFLGLLRIATQEQPMNALFTVHGTSETPEASIGRWRRDLTNDQKEKAKTLTPYLDMLGYQD